MPLSQDLFHAIVDGQAPGRGRWSMTRSRPRRGNPARKLKVNRCLLLIWPISLQMRRRGRPAWKAGPPAGSSSAARDIWISSGSSRPCIVAPRISGFQRVGFIWNSLDFLVRNEPFQWVTGDPGPIFFGGPLSRGHAAKEPAVFDPKVNRAESPRRAEEARQAGDDGGRTSRAGSGHCQQTNADFAFLQGNVVSVAFYANYSGHGRRGPSGKWRPGQRLNLGTRSGFPRRRFKPGAGRQDAEGPEGRRRQARG